VISFVRSTLLPVDVVVSDVPEEAITTRRLTDVHQKPSEVKIVLEVQKYGTGGYRRARILGYGVFLPPGGRGMIRNPW
jgi:hypothetical protein